MFPPVLGALLFRDRPGATNTLSRTYGALTLAHTGAGSRLQRLHTAQHRNEGGRSDTLGRQVKRGPDACDGCG